MGRFPVRTSLATALAGLLALASCAPRPASAPKVDLTQLLNEARKEGLSLENPFTLDPAIDAEVERNIGFGGTPVERMRRIIRYLNDKGYINFHYEAGMTLTAKDAFHARKGDCMAYTNLFLGIARHLRVPVYFVHVSEARSYYERDGLLFVSSHMAVGYGMDERSMKDTTVKVSPYTAVVDFTQETTGMGLVLYEALDDATAVALYYNNVAVDHLVEGDFDQAERLFRFFLERIPQNKEIANNLAVLYLRQGRYDDALRILLDAIGRHPDYQPLFTNAVQAARGSHKPELAQELDSRGKRLISKDPFFFFNRGIRKMDEGDYAGAAAEFQASLKNAPNNPFLCAWLAKALLSAGQIREGINLFAEAQRLAPNNPMLKQMRLEFPALDALPEAGLPESP
jgi:tetratricopeptide (TPR) repeat protein